ncbi:DNA mismatch repair endonuclease MutL [Methylophaga sulfidovorans]|uniref:DNA mismatch repair protein MutL n=1 Tax=Methylophaga sulfidovorans TaxID=45496 RepID=A0A1I4AY69_9GAMM|nr:DNA mismatch repair endonuclease MutL [Methylophaga sulfidovorans]SFK61100.1 DNA mismatch repair protein MutL [Methylophaga sulfidovorans]
MNETRIHALPLHLANQIAAGEVVERPASVLKELVENSIDAGASQIDIIIEGAGSQLIKVTDNGVGIHPEDLALALSRHATSKLHSSEQLSVIGSLGFRGEALPSIASVTRLSLISKQAEHDCAWQVRSDQLQPEPAAHPNGTSVSVAELFFNLPARRRFLRSNKTELHHLITTFYRLALSRFDIGFSARFDEQTSIKLSALKSADTYSQRLAKICGQAFVRDANYLEQSFEDIHLSGWVSKPSAHRAQTDVQYFFINGRVIKDRVINHAIRQAYGDLLPSGRQAAYVLYLTMPLDRVDVNVHPTKHEVRFRDARLIHGLINKAIQEAIQETLEKTDPQTELNLPETRQVNEQVSGYQAEKSSRQSATRVNSLAHTIDWSAASILHGRFIVINSPEPALIDLQQADKRIRQQQFKQAIQDNNLTSRPILVPIRFPLSASDIDKFQHFKTCLSSYAIEFETDDRSLTIKRIPFLLSQVALPDLVKRLTTILDKENNDNEQLLVDELIRLLPESPIHSLEQAKPIIESVLSNNIDKTDCYRKLDPSLLTGLFSSS